MHDISDKTLLFRVKTRLILFCRNIYTHIIYLNISDEKQSFFEEHLYFDHIEKAKTENSAGERSVDLNEI
jgi:hypothetical protein